MINVQFLHICLCFAGTKANELYSAKLHRASFDTLKTLKNRDMDSSTAEQVELAAIGYELVSLPS